MDNQINWDNYPIADDDTFRKRDRQFLLVRKELLLERIPDIEFLRDDFLEGDEFEKHCMFRQWVEQDLTELESLERLLKRFEDMDGPLTDEELEAVTKRLRYLEEEAEQLEGKCE